MITIKDIAKAAGVAQGTVSNVLNGKGNVSSQKIKLVLSAAASLGYIPNEHAKLLSKGQSNLLAVILPNIRSKQYLDFYMGFKVYSENHNFSVIQYLTNDDNPESEAAAYKDIQSLMPTGTAVFSSCPNAEKEGSFYLSQDDVTNGNTIFVERCPEFPCNYIGFNYEKAGSDMAAQAAGKNYSNVCLLTGNLSLSNEAAFYSGFQKKISEYHCNFRHIQTDSYRKLQNIFQIFNETVPDAIFISNYGFAETVKDIHMTFYPEKKIDIYTTSPVFTIPEKDFIKYELNYLQCGKLTAEKLIKKEKPQSLILSNAGFRNWFPGIMPSAGKKPLNVLTLDSPSAYTIRSFSKLYTQKTGIPINMTIYSYEEIYEAFTHMSKDSIFDVVRLDVTWLSWFAEKILQPLDRIDPSVQKDLSGFIPGTVKPYSYINGQIYTFPCTPSMQLLYYRKDLFQDPMMKRTYFEKYKEELKVPVTFSEFNQIAQFFTRKYNPSSPVDYGATLTLGSTGVAGSEFLARFFSYQDNLYNEKEKVILNSDIANKSLEQLIEIKNYSAPKYNSWWVNTAASFAGGNVAMAILYSNYASDLLSSASKVSHNIGFALVPGNNPVLGGGSLGVAKHSKSPREALDFIRWLCSEPVSSANALLGSVSPCLKTYDNYEVVNSYPWLNFAKNQFELARGRRVPEHDTRPFDERHFLSIIGMAVKNVYSNVQSTKDALDNAQQLYDEYFK